jgi:hypothetical protein
VKFTPTNLEHIPLTIEYKSILIAIVNNTKHFGMHIDNHMNWKEKKTQNRSYQNWLLHVMQ